MLRAPLRTLYRRLGPRYPRLAVALQLQVAHLVVLGGVVLLDLFVGLEAERFWRIVLVTQGLVVVENLLSGSVLFSKLRPADPWLRGERTPRTAIAAWRALAGLPLDYVRHRRALPWLLNIIPVSIYIPLELGVALVPGFFVVAAGAAIVLAYGTFLRFFALELIVRPVLEEVSCDVPDRIDLGAVTPTLKWRLLIGLPVINVVTGVIVSALASDGDGLRALGAGVLIALAVTFTISLELSLLLLGSILEPLRELRRGAERVGAGDLGARVPVLGSDEAGRLAESFNEMVAGLEERERLREAFGTFVAPSLAERVLHDGTVLEGDEVEVTVLFLDIRDFTAFAERSSAREVVATLNEFYDHVVPVLVKHGGHANKFVGDGLLGVFGAPERLADHADRGVAAALEIAEVVRDAYEGRVRIGVGVNSGSVVAGTVGGGGHLEFTVIGDPVNTAARVEEITRQTGDDVLVTEATCALLTRDHGGFAARPTVALKGKTERVRLHAPLALAAPGSVGQGCSSPAKMTGSSAVSSS